MAADIRKAAASDRIEDTIDYKKVAKRLLAFVGESQFQLVETLTEHIAQTGRRRSSACAGSKCG